MKTIRDLTKTHRIPSKTGRKSLTASQLKKYLVAVHHWITGTSPESATLLL